MMSDDLNILVLSCGTRNKIVQYFKKEVGNYGRVIATDCSELAPALYDADEHYIVPKMTEEGYLDTILNICRANDIKAVLSLIDPELTFLAQNKESFLNIGTTPIVSDYKVVEMCFDKYKMYEFLVQNGFKTVKSYVDKEQFYSDVEAGYINYPVFIKPVKGSASINISKVTSKEEVELLFSRFDNLMIQEFMDGIEYGADVYIDLFSNEPVSIFIKEKLKMKAGETDKSVSFKDEKLSKLIESFVKTVGFKGVIDIDIFEVDGEYYISEVNPRFGGGYPHAYAAGINVPNMVINNLKGNINENIIGDYVEGIYMLKYNEVVIK
ncbi:ATP-grasp domain-containing protein [Texcoconibacillus texcoconensis]|uniref:Carbamoyl-phosphate synthase large subunit n=1 Tax=Texcoconibacillus texcoconensis TaxID=1095777 RepID=A0A840QT75_9BACI|nr:ATP-grasp domain-containing protein [Texcoconibacillus texcoconensis]MBB5174564.1 carbamoyl-phosphate synthase large subunit [Texcoconibacillus texcoconensis]